MKHLNYACGPIPQKSLQASCIGPRGANGRIGHSQEKQLAPNTNRDINITMVILAGVCSRKINMEPEHGDSKKRIWLSPTCRFHVSFQELFHDHFP